MAEQILSIEQMRTLQKLGVDTSNASAGWFKTDMDTEYFEVFNNAVPKELVGNDNYIPAFTLQDILDILPVTVRDWDKTYELRLKRMYFKREGYQRTMWAVMYEESDYIGHLIMYSHPDLLTAAFEFLRHCIYEGMFWRREEACK